MEVAFGGVRHRFALYCGTKISPTNAMQARFRRLPHTLIDLLAQADTFQLRPDGRFAVDRKCALGDTRPGIEQDPQ